MSCKGGPFCKVLGGARVHDRHGAGDLKTAESPPNSQRPQLHGEEFYQSLGIPYRTVAIVSGELNNAAAKKCAAKSGGAVSVFLSLRFPVPQTPLAPKRGCTSPTCDEVRSRRMVPRRQRGEGQVSAPVELALGGFGKAFEFGGFRN